MERRDFLKYLMSISCASCVFSGCQTNEENISNKTIDIIKFPICYHCNLNCAFCSHFSPIAPKYEVPVEVFERDIKQLKKITKGKVRLFAFMGGEPLLHKNIEKLIEILAKNFPKSKKRITTNGILLEKMPKSFWEICNKNNISIEYSNYTLSKNFPKQNVFKKLSQKHNVEIKSNSEEIKSFELMRLNKSKNNKDAYNLCNKKIGCVQLDNGKLSPCSVISSIKHFNNYFDEYKFKIEEKDFLNIYNISTIDEIFEYLNTPKEFCKHCNFGHNIKSLPWKLSNKQVSEWYEI